MTSYRNLCAISVFVIVYYIQIANAQSIDLREILCLEPASTESSSTRPAYQLKPILFQDEDISYEDFLSRNPGRIEIKSENYPNPYIGLSKQSCNRTAEGGTGVDIIIHDLDLNPEFDFLLIRSTADENSNVTGYMYTGEPVDLPIRIRILSTNTFYYTFVSQATNNKNHRGFLLTYDAYGEIPVVTEPTTTEFPINDLKLEFMTVHLEIEPNQQNNDTWQTLRTSFSDMANQYIMSQNISANESRPEYVVFQSIKTCPSSWRNADSCVSVEFALPVPIVKIDEDDKENQYKVNTTNFDYELTEDNLRSMWNKYAEEILKGKEIKIFEKQNSLELLMWIGVSLGVITIFLIVLYGIWRMDEMNAYRRFRNKRSDSIVPDNNEKPSMPEDQGRYIDPPPFFDDDAIEGPEQIYATNFTTSNNDLFVIADDDLYPRKQSFSSFHQPSTQVHSSNGIPKSALKNTQSMMPPKYTDSNGNLDGNITINMQSSKSPRKRQQVYLQDDAATIQESHS
jgi:hypothetical protein